MASVDTTYFKVLAATGITRPHEDAFVPDGSKTYFRVLKSSEVNSEYFLPTTIKSDKPLPDEFDDCIGKSVSIFDSLEGMIEQLNSATSCKGLRHSHRQCLYFAFLYQ